MQKRHLNRQTYFNEQAATSRKYYTGHIEQYIPLSPHVRVLEIGCGEGGNLLPFAEKGCRVTGVDRSEIRILQAEYFFAQSGYEGTFIREDFFRMQSAGENDTYDVVLIHDVIEHISQKSLFMQHLRQFLTTQSLVFWGFPAWQMPFGGHQQICRSRVCSMLPFIHLLPASLYRAVLKAAGEEQNCITELLDIKACRTTIGSFESLLKTHGYKVLDRELWFINPHYEQKFGLRPRKLYPVLARTRHLHNFFSTSCFYLTCLEDGTFVQPLPD